MAATSRPEENVVSILLITSDDRHESALRSALDAAAYTTHRVSKCGEGLLFLAEHTAEVVLVDADLPDGTWRSILDLTSSLPNPPQLVVFSRLADDSLWGEVLNLGGYDVLAAPLEVEEVRRTLSRACDARRRKPVQSPSPSPGSSSHSAAAA